MVKFQKVLLVIGCVASLINGVISVMEGNINVYAFISASLFFTSYFNVSTIEKLEKNN